MRDYKRTQIGQRLIPVFGANMDIDTSCITLALAKAAAAQGETVLMLDVQNGALMERAGIIYQTTLADVIHEDAELCDAKYVTSNEHFTAMACGDLPLSDILGSLAALSLEYDWVFVGTENGCTPEHVRLAGASDTAVIAYASHSDNFMRAYWMLDSIRSRHPRFDPLLCSLGDAVDANETAELLRATISEFLGAAPVYTGHGYEKQVISAILSAADKQTDFVKVA